MAQTTGRPTNAYGGSRPRNWRPAQDDRHSRPYTYDNTVRKLESYIPEGQQYRELSVAARKNRDRARLMNRAYTVFLMGAICVCLLVLYNYLQLRSELTNRTRSASRLESQLNTLRVDNDEEYNAIMNSINMDEVMQTAIGEFGMSYAKEGQIVFYSSEGSDYMRKISTDN